MYLINWGIIGCGDVSEIKSGPAFSLVADSQLLAVMRRDEAKAKDYAERHEVQTWYTDASDLINNKDINAVYIATPPDTHVLFAIAAMESGKAVYLEKPMGRNATECRVLHDLEIKTGVKISVAHYRREQPKYLKIREILKSGKLGQITGGNLFFSQQIPEKLKGSWRLDPEISGGGLFHDLAPHQLDLVYYFFGKPRLIKPTHKPSHSKNKALHLTADLCFENFKISAEWNFQPEKDQSSDQFIIAGTHGEIRFGVFTALCEVRVGDKVELLDFPHLPHVQQPMIAKVVQYFLGNIENPCSVSEGLHVMEMMDEIIELNS